MIIEAEFRDGRFPLFVKDSYWKIYEEIEGGKTRYQLAKEYGVTDNTIGSKYKNIKSKLERLKSVKYIPLYKYDLSRIYPIECLRREFEIENIKDFENVEESQILRLCGIGEAKLKQIKEILEKEGVTLKKSIPRSIRARGGWHFFYDKLPPEDQTVLVWNKETREFKARIYRYFDEQPHLNRAKDFVEQWTANFKLPMDF